MTTSVQSNTVSPSLLATINGTDKTKSRSATDEAQDRFMKLLVTQMQNQDPLNPLDNAQVTSQLAQLSTVTGIEKLNTTLEALSGSFQSSQSIEAASMIGKGVLVSGNTLNLKGGGALFGIDLPQDAEKVKVEIKDANGRPVHTIDLGELEAGTLAFEWDGRADNGAAAADGQYSFKISASNGDAAVSADALSFGQVGSVTRSPQGVRLNIPNVGEVDLNSVKQIL